MTRESNLPDDRICKNTPRGQHITVRCKGCGSRHSTKNIGAMTDTGEVIAYRTIFDLYDRCKCKDPREFPLIHECEIDDKKDEQ